MLLVFGACHVPFLLAEVGVVVDQGIVDNCPISRHNRQLQLGCAALVRFVVCCRRCWRRDKPSLIQRYVLVLVSKFIANVYLRCLRMPVKWVRSGNVYVVPWVTCPVPWVTFARSPLRRGFTDLLCNMWRLPWFFVSSPCIVGMYQHVVFEFRHRRSVGLPAHNLVAQVRALQTVFAGRVC